MKTMKTIELREKLHREFTVDEFAVNEFAAGLIARGENWTKIAAAVAAAKREWVAKHPAPACTLGKVLDLVRGKYSKEYCQYVGSDVPNWDEVGTLYKRVGDTVVSSTLRSDASAAAIISAVLSYRALVEARKAKAAREMRAARIFGEFGGVISAGLAAGFDVSYIRTRFENCLAAATAAAKRDVETLEANLASLRLARYDILRDLYLLDLACKVQGVFVEDPRAVATTAQGGKLLAQLRKANKQITECSAALYGAAFEL